MSALGLLTTDLQSIATESRRKHPDVREAAEHSLAILKASPEDAATSLSKGDTKADDILKPLFLGCKTRNAKIVGIALGTLQRLITVKILAPTVAPRIVAILTECLSLGVDIQLRILQTLLSLLTNFTDISGELLGDALLTCFRLHDSKTSVVSSTAAATLRQLVILIFDKVAVEDRTAPSTEPGQTTEVQLPDGTTASLRVFANDAFSIFYDLCLLVNSSKPRRLKLNSLQKTFALELIESVLTNHHELFRQHIELKVLLQHQLCPFLLKSLSDKPHFPLTLRSIRVVFLFLRQFMSDLTPESEVFLTLLTKSITGEHEMPGEKPGWVRVLAAEVIRGLCGHPEILTRIWELYDASPSPASRSPVFLNLISAMNRLATEKPSLLGASAQVQGLGLGLSDSTTHLDMGSMAGMVASAASATVSGVVGMMGSESGLSVAGSSMKVSCIDQLDKTESPPIPEAYIYLLALQSLVAIAEALSVQTLPIYSAITVRTPRSNAFGTIYAPRALELSEMEDNSETRRLRTSYAMAEAGWPALLASLSFFMSTNLADELFVDVLGSFRNLIHVAGVLGLSTPRDAFLTSLSKFAVPPRVVSAFDSVLESSHNPRSPAVLSVENLGLTSITGSSSSSGATGQPSLSERNIACLKVFLSAAHFLAGSLGPSWYDVFETLQNAEHVLGFKVSKSTTNKGPGGQTVVDNFAPNATAAAGPGPSSASAADQRLRHPILSELDRDHVRLAIRRLFEVSKNLDPEAFRDFVGSLCRLSADVVEMQSGVEALLESASESMEDVGTFVVPSPMSPRSERIFRRASGMQMPRTVRSGDFGISKIGMVLVLNVQRMVTTEEQDTLRTILRHLLGVLSGSATPSILRLQATETLDEALMLLSRALTPDTETSGHVQRQVLDALAHQMSVHTIHGNATTLDIRRIGLETLHLMLQQTGHNLIIGWETVFNILASVCKTEPNPAKLLFSPPNSAPAKARPPPLQPVGSKSDAAVVRIAFSSLKLICSDYLPSLNIEQLRLCMTTLVVFGQQTDDINIALTAGSGLLSNLSDFIQTKRTENNTEFDELWMFLLHQLFELCDDPRAEARTGSIQTLTRTLQLYGTTLTDVMWEDCLWQVILRLIETLQNRGQKRASSLAPSATDSAGSDNGWNDSKILGWQSASALLSEYLLKPLSTLTSFQKAWAQFLVYVQNAALQEEHSVGTAAMRALERILTSSRRPDQGVLENDGFLWNSAWDTCAAIGTAVISVDAERQSYTQDSLLALIDTFTAIYSLSKRDWNIDEYSELLKICRGVLLYRHSPEYRPDVDSLSPLQGAILKLVESLDEGIPGATSLILKELSGFSRLALLHHQSANESPSSQLEQPIAPSSKSSHIPTYIALAKITMPLLVHRLSPSQITAEFFMDGAVEAVIGAYELPMRLKYECPPSSRHGKDLALWKIATNNFIDVLKTVTHGLEFGGNSLSSDHMTRIWSKVLHCVEGALLADCSKADALTLVEQQAEEDFDRRLLVAVEVNVLPHLGDDRVAFNIVRRLPAVLASCSKLYTPLVDESSSSNITEMSVGPANLLLTPLSTPGSDSVTPVWSADVPYGNPGSVVTIARERFRYWCLDLLLKACSGSHRDHEPERRRLAAVALLPLMDRCRVVLATYNADGQLLGNIPFARIREEELLYLLRELCSLHLWIGSLWAALSTDPSSNAQIQPPVDSTKPAPVLIRDTMLRSSRAHLFLLYPLLAEIAASSRPPAGAWLFDKSSGTAGSSDDRCLLSAESSNERVWVDSRQLATDCLREVGKDMGVGFSV